MIRCNTVNPPGNEMQVGRLLHDALRSAGIESRLLEPAPGRAAVVARIIGNGAKRPVLVMAHMDTVGVEREGWSVDPFAGVVRDGHVYGRGAIDDKGMLAVNLETMLLLQRCVVDQGHTLSRDVIFVANSDEEQSGELGMGWLIANHPELITAEFALNEGGRTRVVDGKLLYVAVQNTEKVPHTVSVTARGPGGHAAVPLEGNAVLRLGRALAAIAGHREPTVITETTREFFSALATVWPHADQRAAMADLVSGKDERVERGARAIASTPVLDALLRNGISATMIEGGSRINVIPTEATARLNVRTLPGQSIDDVVRRLVHAIDDAMVDVAVTSRGEDAPASDFHSPMFAALRESAQALDATLTVVPYMSTGATDSARIRRWGMQAFGLLPFPLDQDNEDRMHGNDERVPVASLEFGTMMIYGAILRVAT